MIYLLCFLLIIGCLEIEKENSLCNANDSRNYSTLENDYIRHQINNTKVSRKKLIEDAIEDAGKVAKNAQFSSEETQTLIEKAKKLK